MLKVLEGLRVQKQSGSTVPLRLLVLEGQHGSLNIVALEPPVSVQAQCRIHQSRSYGLLNISVNQVRLPSFELECYALPTRSLPSAFWKPGTHRPPPAGHRESLHRTPGAPRRSPATSWSRAPWPGPRPGPPRRTSCPVERARWNVQPNQQR